MPKVKKPSALDCITGFCGRRRKTSYKDREDKLMLTPAASVPSLQKELPEFSSHKLEITDFLSTECPPEGPATAIIESKEVESNPEIVMKTIEVEVLPSPENLDMELDSLIGNNKEQVESNAVRFGSSDAEKEEGGTKVYPKTPIKRIEVLEEEEIDMLASNLVTKVVRSALSYFLATLTVRRALESSTILFEPGADFDGSISSSESCVSEADPNVFQYIEALLGEIITAVEDDKTKLSLEELHQIGDGSTPSVKEEDHESLKEKASSYVPSEQSSQMTMTMTEPTITTTNESCDDETSSCSLDWDNEYDIKTPLLRLDGIPTE